MADNPAQEQCYRLVNNIAQTVNTPYVSIPPSAHSDSPRVTSDASLFFNLYALNDLRGLVPPTAVERSVPPEPPAFPHSDRQTLHDVDPPLSRDDRKQLANAQWAASLIEQKIVSDYQDAFGVITPQDIATAQTECGRYAVTNPHDFVVIYIVGSLWSGHAASAKPPLALSRMASAKSLEALLPAMPPNGSQVVTDVSIYLSILKKVSRILIKSPLGA
jgi:hypothetical protein